MKFIRTFVATAAAALLFAVPAIGQVSTWKIDPAHSGVEFQIRHLGVSNVHGSFSNVTGTVVWDEKDASKSKVEATIDTTTVNTGQPKRDEHLKSPDFFDTAKNPTMTFKSTAVKKNNGKLQVVGDFTMNGVTKPITLDVDGPVTPQTMPGRNGQPGKVVSGFSATGTLKRADFNFGPKYAPPMLGDEIKFTIELEVGKQ